LRCPFRNRRAHPSPTQRSLSLPSAYPSAFVSSLGLSYALQCVRSLHRPRWTSIPQLRKHHHWHQPFRPASLAAADAPGVSSAERAEGAPLKPVPVCPFRGHFRGHPADDGWIAVYRSAGKVVFVPLLSLRTCKAGKKNKTQDSHHGQQSIVYIWSSTYTRCPYKETSQQLPTPWACSLRTPSPFPPPQPLTRTG
jgi:hypothetical protein